MTSTGRGRSALRAIVAAAVPLVVLASVGGAMASATGTWGNAQEVPGTAALNTKAAAHVYQVSCPTSGNCVAVGDYATMSGSQAFVASEADGTWHSAMAIPGVTPGIRQYFYSLTCLSAGNCVVGGDNMIGKVNHAFVASEVNGTWQHAVYIAPPANGNRAAINTVSCASAGNCAAGGRYFDPQGHQQTFVVSEVSGTWGNASQVPGTAGLLGYGTTVNSVSCPAAGSCTAGGTDVGAHGHLEAFVANEVNGTWQPAIVVPGTARIDSGSWAAVDSVSCVSPGNCSVGGSVTDQYTRGRPFVASEVNGTWGNAIALQGIYPDIGSSATVDMSCASAGNCSAVGSYRYTNFQAQSQGLAFAVDEVHGTWQHWIPVPGYAALNVGHMSPDLAGAYTVSCASAGNCSAGGAYEDSSGTLQSYTVNEVNGTWQNATPVGGFSTLNHGAGSVLNSVSCAPGGTCSAGGYYTDTSVTPSGAQAFVVGQH